MGEGEGGGKKLVFHSPSPPSPPARGREILGVYFLTHTEDPAANRHLLDLFGPLVDFE